MINGGKFLVLGATSFAGSNLIETLLTAGFDVVGVSRSDEYGELFLPYSNNSRRTSFEFHTVDVRSQEDQLQNLISKLKPNYIFDFAGQGMVAQSWQWPEQWYETNVVAKSKLINFLLNCDFLDRYVRISTPEVYGSTEEVISENAPYNPSTPYSVSHAAIDMHLDAYFKNFCFPFLRGRFANFYGPHQQLYRVIPKICVSAISGEEFRLDGGGHSIRSFIYGTDVASGILAMVKNGTVGETYHFSTDEFVSIKELVKRALSLSDRAYEDVVVEVDDRKGKDAAYLMSSQKAKSALGWKPEISLQVGIENVYRWVEDNIKEISLLPLDYQHKR